jgi:hypothetical protein
LVDGTDPVGCADQDVRSLAPGFEVLVEVSRDVDQPSLGRELERVRFQIALRAEAGGGFEALRVTEIGAIRDREQRGARSRRALERHRASADCCGTHTAPGTVGEQGGNSRGIPRGIPDTRFP